MGFLMKSTALVTLLVAIMMGYAHYQSQKTPIHIELERTYWGHGDPTPDDETIRTFKVNIADSALLDLKERLEKTRFSEGLETGDFSYGFPSQHLKEVVKYWRNQYDWRKHEAILNSFPQFTTQIQGLKIHFIHAKPKGDIQGKPLLMVHGWPGSVWEFYKIIPMLIDPASFGGQPEDAFEVIAPSIPGYGFSEQPHKKGLDQADTMSIFRELMLRLGFHRFFLQGGDWGSRVATFMAANHPENILGVHLNMFTPAKSSWGALIHLLFGSMFPGLLFDEVDADVIRGNPPIKNILEESGYFHLQATKPDTVGTALNDSPAGLAAYILEKFSSWTNFAYVNMSDGGLTQKLTLDELLTNVMIYWLQGNIVSSQRYYKESHLSEAADLIDNLPVNVPSGLACFPHEIIRFPKAIASYKFKNIVQFTSMPRGGHFAAFEEPRLLADDIRSFVRKVSDLQKL